MNASRTNSPDADAFDRKAQFSERRLALIREAARVFNLRGPSRASLDEIAANLNITKPALYYYFKNKEELLYECFLLSFQIGDEAVKHAAETGRTGLEKIEIYIVRHVREGLDQEFPTATAREQDVLSPDASLKVTELRHRRRNALRAFIVEGIQDGSIRPCEPVVVVMSIQGSVSWLFRSYHPDHGLSTEEVATSMALLFVRGLAVQTTWN